MSVKNKTVSTNPDVGILLSQRITRRKMLSSASCVLAVTACGPDGSGLRGNTNAVSTLTLASTAEANSQARPSPATVWPSIQPGAEWTGATGSGFNGNVPMDEQRTSAKPALRLLEPPNQYFNNQLFVGVIGGANNLGSLLDNMGLEKVIVHFEGNRITLNAPSFRTFQDANGDWRTYFGWWVALDKPKQTSGHAHIYFEAVPRDRSMQNRTIGPYQFSPADTLHDFALEVAASAAEIRGQRYRTIGAALAFLAAQQAQNPKITITESALYDIGAGPNGAYGADANGYCLIEASVPVTLGKTTFVNDTAAVARTKYDGLHFRGANISFEREFMIFLHHENVGQKHWLDGIRVSNRLGRNTYWRKGPNVSGLVGNGGYFTECNVAHVGNAFNSADLVRGCRADGLYWDVVSSAACVVNCRFDDIDQTFFRRDVDSFTLKYSGAEEAATLSILGTNDGKPRRFRVVWGGNSAEFVTDSRETDPPDARHFKSWVEALDSGFTCTVHDTTRRISAAGLPGNTGGDFINQPIKNRPLRVVTMFDIHGDWYQQYTRSENVIVYSNVITRTQTQNIFLTGTEIKDFLFVNNSFHNIESENPYVKTSFTFSQLAKKHSHVIIAHNTLSNQGLFLRSDQSYNPDQYCLVANNVLRELAWSGPPSERLVISRQHLLDRAQIPVFAQETSVGGSVLTLFADAEDGDFTPVGALAANLKGPTVRYGGDGRARRSPLAAAGAYG